MKKLFLFIFVNLSFVPVVFGEVQRVDFETDGKILSSFVFQIDKQKTASERDALEPCRNAAAAVARALDMAGSDILTTSASDMAVAMNMKGIQYETAIRRTLNFLNLNIDEKEKSVAYSVYFFGSQDTSGSAQCRVMFVNQ